ncbi:UbiD family decarboxylase [Actinophytocola sp.]|uniref:UbiD family decarboxylase n=1 Tax=Actinophytocola sp. TaxID=1872138 RepID=UPI003D6C6656
MGEPAATSLRGAIRAVRELDELMTTDHPVDPDIEIVALQKIFDGGAALLFDNVVGYPEARMVTNLTATEERLARLFGVEDTHEFKRRMRSALRRPLPPRLVEDAPVQEVVVEGDVDVWSHIPMVSHTRQDPGRTLGGGVTLLSGDHFWGGSHVGYNRMNFRGPNVASFQMAPGSHCDMVATEWYRRGPIPMTINIGVPPSVVVMASAGFMNMVLPAGADELGVAGGLQGAPVDVVRARTVDALAVAEAEWVIEGYLETTEKIWESEAAEAEQVQGKHPFHPEWAGYMGKAYRTYKFTATAVTSRAERPIYHALGVHMKDVHLMTTWTREAAFMELAERLSPGFCTDVRIPWPMTDWGGAVFQTRKIRARDEGAQVNLLTAAMASSRGMKIAIAVDDDIDIYQLDDVMWALTTRVDPARDVHRTLEGGLGQNFQPTHDGGRFAGGLIIDATVPFGMRDQFQRPSYAVDEVDPLRFFSADDVERGMRTQRGWERYLAKFGY